MTDFSLSKKERTELYHLVTTRLERFYASADDYSVSTELQVDDIINAITNLSPDNKIHYTDIVNAVIDGLEKFTVQPSNAKYMGLFNPRTNFPSILADLIAAVFNPQLAAWSHAPYAVEVECDLIREFGKKFGYTTETTDGVFTTGGAEANLTAVLCALNQIFPGYANDGLLVWTIDR